MPEISVIVPVYKVEKYLKRCIDSVLVQTFTDFELILVDDGSPDNCGDICDEYERIDRRVIVIHQENMGLSAARNAGIEAVFAKNSTEWITFIDSDDWVHERYLELLYKSSIENEVNISVCSFLRTSEYISNGLLTGKCSVYGSEMFFVENYLCSTVACAKLYRKELFADLRFPRGKIHEDEYVTYKLMLGEKKISFIDDNLYYYFTNPNSITSSKLTPERLSVCDAFDQQLAFSIENDYSMFRDFVLTRYYRYLIHKLKYLCENETFENQKFHINNLRSRLKKLDKIRKKYGFKRELEKYDLEYGVISPKLTKLHRYKMAIFRKLNIR